MHYQKAQYDASNPPRPRGCRVELSRVGRRKFKKRNEARHRQKNKKEFEELTAENACLKEIIQGLTKYLQIPARDPQQSENSVSHSATQDYDPNLYFQEYQGVASDMEGTADELMDGLELDDLLVDLQSKELTANEPVPEISVSEVIQRNTTVAKFLMKIDEDAASNVDFPTLKMCLEGEHKTIGKYNFPVALVPTVEKIITVYGDISAACLMNSSDTGKIYLLFCAAIKEMEDLALDQVTEEKMLKWWDAIKDALRINFKVAFAVSHLKKIARAYYGRIGSQVLQGIDENLEALQKERAETYEGFKDCMADAKSFYGKSVSTGLFP